MNINMKPDTALTILHKMLKHTHDTWEHDALVYAINLVLKEANKYEHNDSIFTR